MNPQIADAEVLFPQGLAAGTPLALETPKVPEDDILRRAIRSLRNKRTAPALNLAEAIEGYLRPPDSSTTEQGEFGEVLRNARRRANLTQRQLAKAAGLSESTISKIEQGRHSVTDDALRALALVPNLPLPNPVESGSYRGVTPNCYISDGYDSLEMVDALKATLGGVGGAIDQSWLYIEHQSAQDYLRLSSATSYASAYRSQMPVEALARAVVREVSKADGPAGVGIDIVALGPGDGASEVRFCQAVADRVGEARRDIRFYLVDISQPLLNKAYRHAVDVLYEMRGVTPMAFQGSFAMLQRYPQLFYAPPRGRRVRIFTLFGYTLGNLANELTFFRDGLCGAGAGDMIGVDFRQAFASPERPQEIKRRDKILSGEVPKEHAKWLAGPLQRYCGEDVTKIDFAWNLVTDTAIPGSYSIDCIARVQSRTAPPRSFRMISFKRYNPDLFAECLGKVGWHRAEYLPMSTANAAMMLLRKA